MKVMYLYWRSAACNYIFTLIKFGGLLVYGDVGEKKIF